MRLFPPTSCESCTGSCLWQSSRRAAACATRGPCEASRFGRSPMSRAGGTMSRRNPCEATLPSDGCGAKVTPPTPTVPGPGAGQRLARRRSNFRHRADRTRAATPLDQFGRQAGSLKPSPVRPHQKEHQTQHERKTPARCPSSAQNMTPTVTGRGCAKVPPPIEISKSFRILYTNKETWCCPPRACAVSRRSRRSRCCCCCCCCCC